MKRLRRLRLRLTLAPDDAVVAVAVPATGAVAVTVPATVRGVGTTELGPDGGQ